MDTEPTTAELRDEIRKLRQAYESLSSDHQRLDARVKKLEKSAEDARRATSRLGRY